MAKVISPLFSMGASGKLGNSLVYMSWKGIDDVRQYVIPANPRSTDQVAQRGYFTAAVLLWHTTAFNAADKVAFNLAAAQESSAMSGFNKFVKDAVSVAVAGEVWGPLYGVAVAGIDAAGFDVTATGVTGKTYTMKCGLTPSTMNTTFAVTNTVGALTATATGLSASTVYYFQLSNTTAGEGDKSGIVKTKTIAA